MIYWLLSKVPCSVNIDVEKSLFRHVSWGDRQVPMPIVGSSPRSQALADFTKAKCSAVDTRLLSMDSNFRFLENKDIHQAQCTEKVTEILR